MLELSTSRRWLGLCLALGLCDALFGCWRGGSFVGLPTLLIGHVLLQAMMVLGIRILLGPSAGWRSPANWSSAGLISLTVMLPLTLFGAVHWIQVLEGRLATALYNGLFQALAALGTGLLALLLGRRLHACLKGLTLPRPGPLLLSGLALGLLAYGYLWLRRDLLFKELDPWIPLVVLAHGILALLAGPPRPIRKASLSLALGLPLLFLTAALPGARSLTWGQNCLGGRIIPQLSLAMDWDRDGVGHLLGGGDCGPGDPTIYPGAIEIPGDGLDQDCLGGDLKLTVPGPEPKPSEPRRAKPLSPLIVLITVDTLRADHLGLYGYPRLTSPGLDRWAKGGAVFERALTSAPYTKGAIPGLLTGRGISDLKAQLGDEVFRIPAHIPTLAERFQRAGFRSAGFVTALNTHKRFGYRRGFDHFVEITRSHVDSTPQTLERARAWLKEHPGAKRFLWLHLFDPHAPYTNYPQFGFGNTERDRYDSTLAFMDEYLGPFLNELSQQHGALVALTADHGDAFGEHGHHRHGRDLYDPALRVPLLFKGPGIQARRIQTIGSTLDITPTLSSLAGLPVPNLPLGKDLSDLLMGSAEWPDRVVFAEQDLGQSYQRPAHRPLVAVGTAKHSLIYAPQSGQFELYATADKAQAHNLWGLKPDLSRQFHDRLVKLLDEGPNQRRSQVLSRALVKELPSSLRFRGGQRFGGKIEFLGASLWSEQVPRERRRQYRLRLYFRALGKIGRSWRIALALHKGSRSKNLDHLPAGGDLPTHYWPPGLILVDQVDLGSMNRFGAGAFRFSLGFYKGGERLLPARGMLPLNDVGTRAYLGPFRTPTASKKPAPIPLLPGPPEPLKGTKDSP